MEGSCPKCKKHKQLTRHHVLPRCHFGENDEIELICDRCHVKLERVIAKKEGVHKKNNKRKKLNANDYRWIYYNFIEGAL